VKALFIDYLVIVQSMIIKVTHIINREKVKVETSNVMDVIRLTRAITIVLKSKE